MLRTRQNYVEMDAVKANSSQFGGLPALTAAHVAALASVSIDASRLPASDAVTMADVIIAQNAALAAERSLYDTYSLILFSTDKRERHKIVGFHDATRLATLHNSAMPGPLTPRRTKARCAVMMIRPYKPRDSARYLLYLRRSSWLFSPFPRDIVPARSSSSQVRGRGRAAACAHGPVVCGWVAPHTDALRVRGPRTANLLCCHSAWTCQKACRSLCGSSGLPLPLERLASF